MILDLFKKKDPYATFWKWFESNESYFHNNFETNKELLFDNLSLKLKEIDENLTFEISNNPEQKRELIISADGIADSFDNVISLCDAAPPLRDWVVIPFRPRMDSKGIKVNMGEDSLGYNDVYFTYQNRGHYIDLEVYIRFEEDNRHHYVNMYFILLDSLIGEYDAVSKIGNTEFFNLNNVNSPELMNFTELIRIVDAVR
ncbi:hypothetical protein DNH61_04820 [Paenibacillus sambharensis]|uniref:DUF695 domain-containing protein n=1 Tax=Paenibacillus sambharensis TaxID=1803190 RepID=A0A2W1LDV2_9BACL|nr:hypothetical protein [Paenibacillus sambharensis]PZD96973.1 hypothetical protein DNH61_04820 [Paenibacillus sambharensis]